MKTMTLQNLIALAITLVVTSSTCFTQEPLGQKLSAPPLTLKKRLENASEDVQKFEQEKTALLATKASLESEVANEARKAKEKNDRMTRIKDLQKQWIDLQNLRGKARDVTLDKTLSDADLAKAFNEFLQLGLRLNVADQVLRQECGNDSDATRAINRLQDEANMALARENTAKVAIDAMNIPTKGAIATNQRNLNHALIVLAELQHETNMRAMPGIVNQMKEDLRKANNRLEDVSAQLNKLQGVPQQLNNIQATVNENQKILKELKEVVTLSQESINSVAKKLSEKNTSEADARIMKELLERNVALGLSIRNRVEDIDAKGVTQAQFQTLMADMGNLKINLDYMKQRCDTLPPGNWQVVTTTVDSRCNPSGFFARRR